MASPAQFEKGYATRYVAFLDILGFKTLVEVAEQDLKERERLNEMLELMHNTLCNVPAVSMHFTHFSDCILISAEYSAKGLGQLLTAVSLLMCNLLQFDGLVRGGISLGGIYHDGEFVYGTGVNRAVQLEKEANGPVVLLSTDVANEAHAYGGEIPTLLVKDHLARPTVHYLHDYEVYDSQLKSPGTVVLEYPAKRIVYFMSKRLAIAKDRALLKAEWFRDYWNAIASKNGFLPLIPLLGSTSLPPEPPEGPTIIFRRLVA